MQQEEIEKINLDYKSKVTGLMELLLSRGNLTTQFMVRFVKSKTNVQRPKYNSYFSVVLQHARLFRKILNIYKL